MFTVFSFDGEWKPTGQTYESPEDAYDDYGEENVRPIGNQGVVYALHGDERSDDFPDIMLDAPANNRIDSGAISATDI